MKILVTGAAGFIGFHLAQNLLKKKFKVIGIDNINNYYSPKLKKLRLQILKQHKNFTFYKSDITKFSNLKKIFRLNPEDLMEKTKSLSHPYRQAKKLENLISNK